MGKFRENFYIAVAMKGKFPFISPEFPQGNYEEISAGMILWNSPIYPRGNLGHVDGCGWLARWEFM